MRDFSMTVWELKHKTVAPQFSLKGHCHAIWQLYKKLEGVFASIEVQN